MVRHTKEVQEVAAAIYNTLSSTFKVSLAFEMPPNVAQHNPPLARMWEEWNQTSRRYQQAFTQTLQRIKRHRLGDAVRKFTNSPYGVSVADSLKEMSTEDQLYVAYHGRNWMEAKALQQEYDNLMLLKPQLLLLLDQAGNAPLVGTCLRCKETRWYQYK
jgi:hypothetical protein